MLKFPGRPAMRSRVVLSQLVDILRGLRTPDSWQSGSTAEVLFISHDVHRPYQFDGKAYSPLVDTVETELHRLGYRTASVAHPWSVLSGDKAWGYPLSCNRSFLAYMAKEYAFAVLKCHRRHKPPLSVLSSVQHWIRLYQHFGARVVFAISPSTAMCEAAHAIGIPLVELLHGHRYSFIWLDYDKRSHHELPSHILATDQMTLATYKVLELLGVEVLLARWPSANGTNKILTNSSSMFKDEHVAKPLSSSRTLVTIALQWSYHPGSISAGQFSNGIFPDELSEAIRATREQIDWVIRLHPKQLREHRYRSDIQIVGLLQQESNVASFQFSQQPLETLLTRTDVLVTPRSGTAAEALSSGVPVIFLDRDPTMREHIKSSYAREFESGMCKFWDGGTIPLINQILSISQMRTNRHEVRDSDTLTCADVVIRLLER